LTSVPILKSHVQEILWSQYLLDYFCEVLHRHCVVVCMSDCAIMNKLNIAIYKHLHVTWLVLYWFLVSELFHILDKLLEVSFYCYLQYYSSVSSFLFILFICLGRSSFVVDKHWNIKVTIVCYFDHCLLSVRYVFWIF